MGLFDHFPYTNVHELNLDWVLSMMKALEAEWEAFTAGNSLTFADPMLHDVTKTYAKNTIVLDDIGNAYVSLQAVPVGVGLQNGDYWLMVFDYEAFIEKVNKNFTVRYYRGSYRATAAMAIGDWLTVDDVLYKATAAIAVNDVLEDGVNITHFTLEDFIKAFMQSANQLIQQYKNDIDASELLYRQQLAQDIANTTASLQAQLDAAISGATVDSEVINARVGADGVTYATLGDAIRTQINNCFTVQPIVTTSNYSTNLPDCDNVNKNYVYPLLITPQGTSAIPAHLPWNSWQPTVPNALLICTSTVRQFLIAGNQIYTRFKSGAIWSSWSSYDFSHYLEEIPATITSSNYSTDLPDCNIRVNKIYQLLFTAGSTSIPANLPWASYPLTTHMKLLCMDNFQILFYQGIFYTRFYAGAWGSWVKMDIGIDDLLHVVDYVTSGNMSTVLSDLNSANPMSFYLLNFGDGSTSIPTNSPFLINEGNCNSLLTLHKNGASLKQQLYINSKGGLFTRVGAGGTWQKWIAMTDGHNSHVTVHNGDNLSEIIINNQGRVIYVEDGTYDIIQDYIDMYGATYWDNYVDYDSGEGWGVPVQDCTRLIFSPAARVVCNYTGANTNVSQYFSAFSLGTGAYIEGLNLYTRGLRYAIHDDKRTSTVFATNELRSCYIDSDSRCIGGGMKQDMKYIFRDCTFKSNYAQGDITYHNGGGSIEECAFSCSECYFEHTLGLINYGTSTKVTQCYVTNNSLGSAIIVTPPSGSDPENIKLLDWNNVIRP